MHGATWDNSSSVKGHMMHVNNNEYEHEYIIAIDFITDDHYYDILAIHVCTTSTSASLNYVRTVHVCHCIGQARTTGI